MFVSALLYILNDRDLDIVSSIIFGVNNSLIYNFQCNTIILIFLQIITALLTIPFSVLFPIIFKMRIKRKSKKNQSGVPQSSPIRRDSQLFTDFKKVRFKFEIEI